MCLLGSCRQTAAACSELRYFAGSCTGHEWPVLLHYVVHTPSMPLATVRAKVRVEEASVHPQATLAAC